MSELKFEDAEDAFDLLIDILNGLWTKRQDRIRLEEPLPLKHGKSHVFECFG